MIKSEQGLLKKQMNSSMYNLYEMTLAAAVQAKDDDTAK